MLPTLLAGAYFAANGELDTFIDANFLANLRHASPASAAVAATAFRDSMLSWSVATGPLWSVIIACMVLRRVRGVCPAMKSGHWLLLGWVAVGVIEASTTRHFYRHYYLVTLPPLCMLWAEAAAEGIWLRFRSLPPWFLALAFSAFPVGAISVKYYASWIVEQQRGPDTPKRIAMFLRWRLQPGDSLFVLDYEPIVYFLADARPATRYVFPPFLLSPHFGGVAQVDYREEFARIVRRKPRCVVMHANSFGRGATFRSMLGSNYPVQGTFDGVDVRCRETH
jgi:hypothetical protein